MFKLILLVPAAAALVLAGEGIYHAVAGRQQVAVVVRRVPARSTCVSAGPRHRVRHQLRGRRLSRIVADRSRSCILPARPAGSQAVAAPFVVATRDPAAIALARTVLGGGRRTTSEQSLGAMQRVVAQLRLTDAIDGLVRTGIIERLRSRRILSGLAPPHRRERARRRPSRHAGLPDARPGAPGRSAARAACVLAARDAVCRPPRPSNPRRRLRRCRSVSNLLRSSPVSHDPEHAFDELSELSTNSRRVRTRARARWRCRDCSSSRSMFRRDPRRSKARRRSARARMSRPCCAASFRI